MRRLIGLIALLVIVLGAAWLVQQGYDRAQTAGDTVAGGESSMSADVWDTTPAVEQPAAANDGATPEQSAAPESEMAATAPGSESESVAPPSEGAVPTFDIVRVEPTGNTVIAGLAEPQAMVELLDGAEALAIAEANERGAWAMALEEPLPPGTHDLAIRTTSPDKSTVTLSDQRIAVEISEGGAEEPLVVLNEPNAPSQVMQMPSEQEVAAAADAAMSGPETSRSPAEPLMADEPAATTDAPSTGAASDTEMAAVAPQPGGVTEMPAAEPSDAAEQASGGSGAAPEAADSASAPSGGQTPPAAVGEAGPPEPKVSVAAVEAETNGALYIAGTSTTSEPVRVYLDEELVGEATPSPSGTWLVETTREVPPGDYLVRADQIEGGSGSVIARAEVPFARQIEVAVLKPAGEAAAPGSAEISGRVAEPKTVIIKRGDNLWRISRELYGDGVRYSTIYRANTDQIRDPDLIYPGQVFVLPAGDTAWETN